MRPQTMGKMMIEPMPRSIFSWPMSWTETAMARASAATGSVSLVPALVTGAVVVLVLMV